ncbi:type II secretion system protein [Pseudoalteromonas tunicata]|uniref:type II secretion system protein n=1 Tax=Pseudoalteromonas tunicata TaxID=314281 RepID=UPI00273ECD5E|nr:type II secretion system protein [Pseudoalteromonas tunicata]MDP4985085.1 type II secretion system GspH family protein [Pseudoalteromonas tunicata]
MKRSGFTLVELILVIVILGIVSVGTVQYLSFGAQIYAQATERDEVVSQARFLQTRLSKELRHAAPNSVRLSCDNSTSNPCSVVQCLEFTPFKSSTVYTNNLPSDLAASGDVTVVDALVDPVINDWVSIYALSAADVYQLTNNKRRQIMSVTQGANTTQPDVWQVDKGFSVDSPSKRIYVLNSAGPVSFCVKENTLYRFEGYGFFDSQPTPTLLNQINGVSGVAIGQFVQNALNITEVFRYQSASLTRNSVVNIQLEMGFNNTESVAFNHEIHLPNVP